MQQKKWFVASFVVIILFLFLFIQSAVWWKSSPVALSETLQTYIVQGNDIDEITSLIQTYGGLVTSRLDIVRGVGTLLPETAVTTLRQHPAITRITPNMVATSVGPTGGQPTADYSEVVNANDVWAQGITGKGVTVAVIDTGIADSLPGLRKDTKNGSRIVAWKDFVAAASSPVDLNGHGSHVAGIIASSEVGADTVWNGIAPDVSLVIVRVLDENGSGTYEQVILGIQWIIDHKELYNIRVLNLSLVANVQTPYWADPLNQAVMAAWANGITVITAAGNTGPGPMSIGAPGNNPYVITVGAFTDNYTPPEWSDDYLAPFSAAGPTLDGFVKPDLVAPGAHMVSSMKANSLLARTYKSYRIGGKDFSMAGTSQATAVVSGIAALMIAQDPTLTPDQVKYRLTQTALVWTDPTTHMPLYSIWQQGAGRVNAPAAVFTTTQAVANVGLNIQDDLAGLTHFEGFSYYDEVAGEFRLRAPVSDPDAAEETADSDASLEAGGYSAWAGGYSAWAGGYSAWAGGYSAWAGGYSAWAGGYSAWAGGHEVWLGSEPWPAGYHDSVFVSSFLAGESPTLAAAANLLAPWVEEVNE